MANPSLVLRGGNSGPTFDPSTPGFVLTVQADGKSVAPEAAASGGLTSFAGRTTPAAVPTAGDYDASEIVNDSNQPGVSLADALNGSAISAGNSGATKNLSFLNGCVQKLTLTANCTVTITDLPATPAWIELELTQDATGSRTLTIATAKTPGGLGLTLSTAPNALDIVDVYWNGTGLRASVAGLAFS